MPKVHIHLESNVDGGEDIDGTETCPRGEGAHDGFCDSFRGRSVEHNRVLTYLLAESFVKTHDGTPLPHPF
jgi:hypothetical protein